MTMTIPPRVESINIVELLSFTIDSKRKMIFISFMYGYKDASGNKKLIDTDTISLGSPKYLQLLQATPPGNKTFSQWIRPHIYSEIADYLGVQVGDID